MLLRRLVILVSVVVPVLQETLKFLLWRHVGVVQWLILHDHWLQQITVH